MADEAFALSPISARATLPSEEDYAAISEAFMETARGRWFLGEYAKRNRNADTRMVLDAVARIEESLAAQKQPPPDSGLAEALIAIRDAVEAARNTATLALDGLALEQHLAPVRKGARVIREIAWRLREIGADGRICDLIDSQISAIEAGTAQISSAEASAALEAAFASIEGRVAVFDAGDEAPAPAKAETARVVVPFPPPEPAPAARVETAPAQEVPEIAAEMPHAADAIPVTAAAAGLSDEAADAHDEAMLDLIALEMGAPDPDDIADSFEMAMVEAPEANFVELMPATPEIVAHAPVPVAVPIEPQVPSPPQSAPAASPEPAMEVSLGSTIIASGMLRKPGPPANDPLAPIRRMSQAEKIAFFS